MKLFVCGYPGLVGSKKTSLWHTLRLWKSCEIDVGLIPMWTDDRRIRGRCDQMGLKTYSVRGPRELSTIPFLRDSTVVSFGEQEFLRHAHVFRELGCRIIWANPQTSISRNELQHWEHFGTFDCYVFSTESHFAQLWPQLEDLGVGIDQCSVIATPILMDEFPFRPKPRLRTKPFCVGQLMSSDSKRWSRGLWPMIRSIRYRSVETRVMGWTSRTKHKLGSPPPNAKVFRPDSMSTNRFLRSLHCLFAVEATSPTCPRVGLEAMASGVPIIAPNLAGWRGLIKHGQTGFLANRLSEFAHFVELLARDEQLRLDIARRANESCSTAEIRTSWQRLVIGMSASEPATAI